MYLWSAVCTCWPNESLILWGLSGKPSANKGWLCHHALPLLLLPLARPHDLEHLLLGHWPYLQSAADAYLVIRTGSAGKALYILVTQRSRILAACDNSQGSYLRQRHLPLASFLFPLLLDCVAEDLCSVHLHQGKALRYLLSLL